ncbi:RluA family pseudouridine synthase [Pseudoteredinibacter isoporae]|uniref:tRNA pseudouridine32 synthase/23S rRNA pseudouridine746 synthase n=1 Tax=Pseudoteredinibacter isoporae TaxID=570281 RepID=A0A7X0JW52_9GAMM|nr:RluA family pseudouridine synthase [Pseudoteredinibacter isoporae]MBB6523333.1 tRNA pseudouridine32 synthase/23S rRNA pseudouridine746 synthase [Pseudoteredinibacter isoporae]NHO88847.1 RluA family pseudouridine synthase [Pseudoteredinibacter isoporae]NIB24445.1 RluA family pseudouridine synthase [Pseudoteredinibacter isoporae]
MSDVQEYHLNIDSDKAHRSPLDLLVEHSGLSRNVIKQAMSKGAVWRQRGKKALPLRRNSDNCKDIAQLHFYYQPDILSQIPQQAELIKDLQDYSVWLKPRGMRSQGSRFADHCALVRVAEQAISRPCRIVHRLDQDACGLILLAHNKAAARHLSELFAQHTIEKRYHIVVDGDFPEQKQIIDQTLDDKPAYSEFSKLTVLEGNRSLVEVRITTGRKHQVRRHAALLGYPVIGDSRYGKDNRKNNGESNEKDTHGGSAQYPLQLCAQQLSFSDHQGHDQQFSINSQAWLQAITEASNTPSNYPINT